jgi:hypothetical protein
MAHDVLPVGVNGADVTGATGVRVGVRVVGVTGAGVVAGGVPPPQLPQSVQSGPAEQKFGSSHMLSFAYLHVSWLPSGDATGAPVGARVLGVTGADDGAAVARVGARVAGVVGANVAGATGAEVEDEHVPQVFGQALLIVAP